MNSPNSFSKVYCLMKDLFVGDDLYISDALYIVHHLSYPMVVISFCCLA